MGCSSSTHTWDAFQLARAAFRLYCVGSNYDLTVIADDNMMRDLEPQLIGEPLKIDVEPPEVEVGEGEDEDGSLEALPAISIHDNNVTMRFLICGLPCTPVSSSQAFVYIRVPLGTPAYLYAGMSAFSIISYFTWSSL